MHLIRILTIYVFSLFIKALFCLHGENVCDYIVRGNKVTKCCSDHEESYKMCIPCQTGFTTENGEKCRPCADGTYGYKCTETCDCNLFQRCDNVKGCVSELNNFRPKGDGEKNMTTIQSTVSEITNEGKFEIANATYYYIITTMTLVFVCFACFMWFKYRRASKTKKVPQRISRHSYAEVDETAFNESTQVDSASSGSYLDMVSNSNTRKVDYPNENKMRKDGSSFDESTNSILFGEDNIDGNIKTKYKSSVSDILQRNKSVLKCQNDDSAIISATLDNKLDCGIAGYEEPVMSAFKQ